MSPELREFKRLMDQMGWSQAETARRTNLTRSAISQVVSGKNTPELALERIRMAVAAVSGDQGASLIRDAAQKYATRTNLAEHCRAHLNRFLVNCHGDPDKLSWTKVQLQRVFPLNLWGTEGDAPPPPSAPPVNSEKADAAALSALKRAAADTTASAAVRKPRKSASPNDAVSSP